MNTERDDREQIEAIRKMMAEKEEKKRASRGSKQTARSVCHCRNSGTRGCEERWHP